MLGHQAFQSNECAPEGLFCFVDRAVRLVGLSEVVANGASKIDVFSGVGLSLFQITDRC